MCNVESVSPPFSTRKAWFAAVFPLEQTVYPLVIRGDQSWLAMGNPMQMEVSMGKSQINGGLSIAMFDYWRVHPFTLFAINPQIWRAAPALRCRQTALVSAESQGTISYRARAK